jgi:ribonuclease HII
MDFLSILRFMKEDGELKNLLLVDENIPKIDELNPTLSYVGYEILFLTDKDKDGTEEIFEFVLDDMKLDIFLADDLQAFEKIIDNSTFHIVSFSALEVDRLGISKCMKQALEEITSTLQAKKYLFDGNTNFGIKNLPTKIKAPIISKVFST